MITYNHIYDISVTLGTQHINFPKDTPYKREMRWQIKKNQGCDLSTLTMSSHSGTHIDMPSHFISGGKQLGDFPLSQFILVAQVIEIKDPEAVRIEEIQNNTMKPNTAVLFKTKNSRSGININQEFTESFVYMTGEAANLLVQRGISIVGIDYITLDKYKAEGYPAHNTLLSNNIPILEGIQLKAVPPGEYTLICLPLKINNGEASPVRAVLLN